MRRILAVLFSLAFATTLLSAQDDMTQKARRIQSQVIGIDSHNDTMQRVLIEHFDVGKRNDTGQVDLPRLREGGMHAPFFALWVPTYYHGAEAVRRTLELRDALQGVLDKYPDQVELATSAADVERIVKSGKIAAIASLEGGHQIDNDLGVLREYRRRGIMAMTLTHFKNNDWADSSTDTPAHNGLTDFGREVVREMNRIGMMVDISHVSDKTFYDVLEVTTKPVIATHSSCRALADIPRNMTDDMLRALAKNGGVVGINFAGGFVNNKDAESIRATIGRLNAAEPNLTGAELDAYAAKEHLAEDRSHAHTQNATLDDVVAQIDHAVKVAGIDHVGIGTDYDGIPTVPVGLEDVSKMPALTAALLKKGYSEQDIKKIMGGNTLRVMREVVGR